FATSIRRRAQTYLGSILMGKSQLREVGFPGTACLRSCGNGDMNHRGCEWPGGAHERGRLRQCGRDIESTEETGMTTKKYETVLIEKQDGITWLVMNR